MAYQSLLPTHSPESNLTKHPGGTSTRCETPTVRPDRHRARTDGPAGLPRGVGDGRGRRRRRRRLVGDLPGRAAGLPGSAGRYEHAGLAGPGGAPQGHRPAPRPRPTAHPGRRSARASGTGWTGRTPRSVAGRAHRAVGRPRGAAAQAAVRGGLPPPGRPALRRDRRAARQLRGRRATGGRRRHQSPARPNQADRYRRPGGNPMNETMPALPTPARPTPTRPPPTPAFPTSALPTMPAITEDTMDTLR